MGYDKTEFRIDYVMNGIPDHYEGRQDLGDGEGALIEHIEKYHTYYANDPNWENYLLQHEGSRSFCSSAKCPSMLLMISAAVARIVSRELFSSASSRPLLHPATYPKE